MVFGILGLGYFGQTMKLRRIWFDVIYVYTLEVKRLFIEWFFCKDW